MIRIEHFAKNFWWCPKKYAAYFLIVFHYIYLHIGTTSQKP